MVTDGESWYIKQREPADVHVVPEVEVSAATPPAGSHRKPFKNVSDVELPSKVCLGGWPVYRNVCWTHTAIHHRHPSDTAVTTETVATETDSPALQVHQD